MALFVAALPLRRLTLLLLPLWATLSVCALRAQTPSDAPTQPPYHLSTASRLVLTDITVTDDKGQRVQGLKASDFLITDDGRPEKLSSFTEHTPKDAPPVSDGLPAHPGVYTNDLLLHPPPVLNVILIDITNLELVEQLYLNYQLTRLINTLPSGQPIALYWVRQSNIILLQDFTANHGRLLTALHKALPRFPPTGREYYSNANTLHQLAVSLAQLPGRKNVLWFSGGTAALNSPLQGLVNITPEEEAALHVVYDELESSRITIYPFDARGLVTYSGASLITQQNLMREIADNTGGHAFVNTNGLQLEAAHLIASDGAYYTLTYSPTGFKPDGRWHKVQVSLAAPYTALHLSYRRGYFADDPAQPKTANALSSQKAAAAAAASTPDRQSPPIIFNMQPIPMNPAAASFVPAKINLTLSSAKAKHGTILYTLRYQLPLDVFTIQQTGNQPITKVGIAALAFDDYGSIATHRAEQITLDLDKSKLPLQPGSTVTIDQQVVLPKGDTTLFCAIWDVASRRLGTLQIPLVVKNGPH